MYKRQVRHHPYLLVNGYTPLILAAKHDAMNVAMLFIEKYHAEVCRRHGEERRKEDGISRMISGVRTLARA